MTSNALHSSHRSCPICGKKNANIIYQNDLAILDNLDMSYGVTVCEDCDFVYANILPRVEQYEAYYQGLSKYDVVVDLGSVPAVDQYRAQCAVDFCRPYMKYDVKIADLGCGSGVLLNAFRQAGWNSLYGLDPAPNAHNKTKEIFSLSDVYTGTLDQAAEKLPLAEIDLVCLMGVLEHLPMLRENLEGLVRELPAKVKIMIEVPALERFCRDEMEPYGEFSLEHIQYFSVKTLIQLMESLGFSPIDISYLELPKGSTDSLLCLFGKQVEQKIFLHEQSNIAHYLHQSKTMMDCAMQAITSCEGKQFIIYGAGSHTARLLPRLQHTGWADKLICLVDSNTNLHGKSMGGLAIKSPDALVNYPNVIIIISSFRSQNSIAQALSLKLSNPLLLLY